MINSLQEKIEQNNRKYGEGNWRFGYVSLTTHGYPAQVAISKRNREMIGDVNANRLDLIREYCDATTIIEFNGCEIGAINSDRNGALFLQNVSNITGAIVIGYTGKGYIGGTYNVGDKITRYPIQ